MRTQPDLTNIVELTKRAREGDQAALEALCESCLHSLSRYAVGRVPPKVRDMTLTKAADVTPGIAAIASTMSFCRRATCWGSGTSDGGIDISTVCSVSGRTNPGSTFLSAWNVRIINPELMRSTRASAT